MDEAGIEATGLAPLQPILDRFAAIDSHAALSRALGEELRADVDALNNTNFRTDRLFGVWVTAALDDPATSRPYLLQGGLDLPDREYYLAALRAHGRRPQGVCRPRLAHAAARRRWPIPTPRRPRSSRSKPRWRARTPPAPSRSTC